MRRLESDRLSPAILRTVQRAWGLCRAGGREEVTLEAFWTALRIEEHEARERLAAVGLALDPLDDTPLPAVPPTRMLADAVRRTLADAEQLARQAGRHAIASSDHLLVALATQSSAVAEAVTQAGLDVDSLRQSLLSDAGLKAAPIDIGVDLDDVAPPVDDDALVLRLLDASGNRLGEGLRVIEDYVRFVMNDADLSEACKSLRHRLPGLMNHLPLEHRTAVRDVPRDVGTEIELPTEQARGTGRDVLVANLRRAAESLRSLEEFAKTRDGELARDFERLRYDLYGVESRIIRTLASRDRLADRRLMLLVSPETLPGRLETIVGSAIAGGVDIVQLRVKSGDDCDTLAVARTLRTLTRETETLLLVNDRPDLAVLCDADGVHVGQDDLSCADARRIAGGERLVGVSTHDMRQARRAREDGADYIGCGPTFPSDTKAFDEFVGPALIASVTEAMTLPAFAIGGITPENAGQIAGGRVAVSRAVTHAEQPEHAAKQLRAALARLESPTSA